MSWEIDRSAIGQWGPDTLMRIEHAVICITDRRGADGIRLLAA